MEKKQYDIFISHSNIDQEIAVSLCTVLEQKGLTCWIAPRNVGVGHYSTSIVEGIESSKAMVLLLSSNSNQSTPVLNELESATNNQLLLIPIRIEDVMPTKSIGYYIRTNNWFDNFYPKSMEEFTNVAETIKDTFDSSNTITHRLITPTINKSKDFSLKSFTFVLLFVTLMLTLFSFNSYATNATQEKLLEQKDKIIEQYQKLLEQNKDNSKTISQAEHIKDIAGYKEAIKYFKSKDKNLFYTNYENIKLLYYTSHGTTIDNGNGSIINTNSNYYKSTISSKFILNIKTIPISSNIRILNIDKKYKNNLYLPKNIYNIEISSDGYSKKAFNIKIDKNTNITVNLKPIVEIRE